MSSEIRDEAEWRNNITERLEELEFKLNNHVLFETQNQSERVGGLETLSSIDTGLSGAINFYNPVDHLLTKLNTPAGEIKIRSTAIIVTHATDSTLNLFFIDEAGNDGQFAYLKPDDTKTLNLNVGGNFDITQQIIVKDNRWQMMMFSEDAGNKWLPVGGNVFNPVHEDFDVNGFEIKGWNRLESVAGANKAIDSVSGGINYDTLDTTVHQFRVRNVGDTAFINVGVFSVGGLALDDLNLSNVSGINFSNSGVSINDASFDMNFGVPADQEFIFTSGAGVILRLGLLSALKTIDVDSSEIINFNVLRSTSNKAIDSVSGGWNYETANTTAHTFRVHNGAIFVDVGHFDAGGLNLDDLNISNVSGINFSQTGVSVNDASSNLTLGVPADQNVILNSGAGDILRAGLISGQKTLDIQSSEIINFNVLRSGTNKAIDSISGGYSFDTPNTTEFNFRVRNAGDTAWINVGTFDAGGFKGENLPIAEIFSISFTNAGAISNSSTNMTFGIGSGDIFRNTIGGFLEFEITSTKIDIDAKYIELESIVSPGVTGSVTTGRVFMDSGNSEHLSIIRNGSIIDLETSSVGTLDDLTDVTITAPANNEVLAFDGISTWINQTADQAQLVTINTTQTISGLKTFSANVSINSGNRLNFDGGTSQTYITEDASDNLEFHVDTTDFFEFFAAEGDANPIIRFESDGTFVFVPDGHQITTQGSSLEFGVEQTTHAFEWKVDISATPELIMRVEDDLFRKVGAAFQSLELYNTVNAVDNSSIAELVFYKDNEGGTKTNYAAIAGIVHNAGTVLGDREGALHFLVTHGASNSAIYVIEGGESNTTSRLGWYDKASNPAVQQTLSSNPTTAQISTVLRNYGLTKL